MIGAKKIEHLLILVDQEHTRIIFRTYHRPFRVRAVTDGLGASRPRLASVLLDIRSHSPRKIGEDDVRIVAGCPEMQ